MKKTAFLLGLIVLLSCDKTTPTPATSQTKETKVETNEEGLKHITYHKNGLVNVVTDIKNDKRNGLRLEVDSRGNVINQNMYENDELHGIQLKYGTSGKLKLKATYKHGVLDGEYVKYQKDGKNYQESCFYVNGKKDGKASWYYSSGKVSMTYNYENGNINGLAKKYYDISGALKSEVMFKDGKMVGEWKDVTGNTENGKQ